MIRRAQEMRIAAQSMTEVAFRLAEPESLAQDRVMMIGQAVRREVAAMGEGIERTLARAVELETLVHTRGQRDRTLLFAERRPVSARSSTGSGSEREAVVTHAERVRASITGAHETLKRGNRRCQRHHSRQHPQCLDQAVDDDHQFRRHADRPNQRERDDDLRIDRPAGSIRSLTALDLGRSLRQPSRYAHRQADADTDDVTRSLTDMLDERTNGMVSLLGGAARTLNSEFEAACTSIERTLAERGQALISEFQTRAEALDTGTQKLNAALEARARQINETLVERAREIARHIRREQGKRCRQ